ncbi:ATP-binding protein [Devosia sp. BK]|uniref:AlbA family DNA-binding domain-containing protein n=1 Tax=Devosia sp. BK TaxID=2871706 RepID=UPI00293AF81B|nr:ATP-binding protein [Devosia sp. BK]MDV3251121.1 ATP-binding protein [Devosia sp. BK]
MAKRNITDDEIGLIKAMLKRGMRNDEAHFHFNRQDRLISPGRIAQIKSGKYGGGVAIANDSALDQFLTAFRQRSGTPAKANMPAGPGSSHLFEDNGGVFRLRGTETDTIECKLSFRMQQNRFAEIVKSIAGMANNKGGMILFGVRDGTLVVEGLTDDEFEKTDPAAINRFLAGALDPVPHITKSAIRIDGKYIGILTVEPHPNAPVIALKVIGQDVKEGCIYFRYVGETRTIKPGELRHIINMREQRAVAEFSRRMMGVATGEQATDVRPKSPPVLRRVLGLMFGPKRPVFPVPDCWQIRWA